MLKNFYLTIIIAIFGISFVKPQFDEEYSKKLINFVAASFLPVNDTIINDTRKIAETCFKKSYPNEDWQLLNIDFIDPCTRFNIDLCQVLIAKSANLKEIIFAFNGYIYPDQIKLLANLTFDNFVPWNISDIGGGGNGKVISDFIKASETVWSSHVKDILNEYPDYSITFTGHSLGSPIASLTALKAKLLGFNQTIKVYTFGEPRIGDIDWAKKYKEQIPQSFRVVHSSDLLPHMPVCEGLFSGKCENKLGYPYHQPQEIWYDDYQMSNGKYKICSNVDGEDPNCSNSIPEDQFDKNLIDWQGFDMQMRYYDHRLYDYGNAGCNDPVFDSSSTTATTTTKATTMTATTTADSSSANVVWLGGYFYVLTVYHFLSRYIF